MRRIEGISTPLPKLKRRDYDVANRAETEATGREIDEEVRQGVSSRVAYEQGRG